MARYDDNWIIIVLFYVILLISNEVAVNNATESQNNDSLTACQHLRSAESRRAKALGDVGVSVRIPKCSRLGDFEPIQCSNEVNGTECWCVDEYGVEIVGTRRDSEKDVNCAAPSPCSASSCRMFCPSGFARDARSGCPICQCRDPCEGVQCPGGLACQPQEVKCITEPCPPIPTCKRARSLNDLCPAGQPLAITGTIRPFLCGNDPGKPSCPPLYRCLVQSGNDYGVCCPASLKFEKPGSCPKADEKNTFESTGTLCGSPCSHDLECPQMQKCCNSNGCGRNCQQPTNVTACHQARMLSELLSVNEREGRGYVPQCTGPGGAFSKIQCSRNGLVCWCVDQQTGNKIKGTMGAASTVNCADAENLIARSIGRSADAGQQCDQNICAAVCEYGFKNDHNGCATCECSDPCEGFLCQAGAHCEVARDPDCSSGSALCASEPVCKPDMAYSNPCDIGTPLVDNVTAEVFFCNNEVSYRNQREYQPRSFFDEEVQPSGRAMTNNIICPSDYSCVKLPKENRNVCCPQVQDSSILDDQPEHQQTMCEYLRDFSERMEGTEDGMELAVSSPRCTKDGSYEAQQCRVKKIKVTPIELKRILEEKNIRQMRQLFSENPRPKRNANNEKKVESLKLVKIEENVYRNGELVTVSETETRRSSDYDDAQMKNVIEFLKSKMHDPTADEGEVYLAELLSSRMLNQEVQGRTAKVIDNGKNKFQNFEKHFDKDKKENDKIKLIPLVQKPAELSNELVEVEIEECWCVDGFGTEIPKTKSRNTTKNQCEELRETLECLDLTCRMGCDYGFVLDADTRCPSCECRDPCDSIECPDGQECRSVEVSCEGEYCPPVPACLPRKPGQCPFLIPPGSDDSDSDSCEYECRSDFHCDGNKRCCSNGCGTQCVEPQLKTACQHLQSIQLHQATELGIPAKQKYIVQCNQKDGSYNSVQCGPSSCWCVDEEGNERSGTKTTSGKPNCDKKPQIECPLFKCSPCDHGYLIDDKGCRTCECRNPCNDISCPNGEECQLIQVECITTPCPKMPICVPYRESVCPEGSPLRLSGKEISCGPQNDADPCPTTHTCQLNPMTQKGVCCGKTRDVCFESTELNCMKLAGNDSDDIIIKWRFSPRQNKCVTLQMSRLTSSLCQSKNVFHSESACNAVCPVLSQCERLKMKNSVTAKRSGQNAALFQPRCDPETGNWSPVQCLTSSPTSRDGSGKMIDEQISVGVCWCADKRGAPIGGSLTRGTEPQCNHRQARRRMQPEDAADPIVEELITILVDDNNFVDFEPSEDSNSLKSVGVTERILAFASTKDIEEKSSSTKLVASTTRCQALRSTAPFPVACDDKGAFMPTQCNVNICWCVDAAGNQLPFSRTFPVGTNKCVFTQIESVSVELHLSNPNKNSYKNVYETLKTELTTLLNATPDNFRVHENSDGSISLKFDLTEDNKIDTAFALEEMAKQNNLILVNGELNADITLSSFWHKNTNLPVPQPASGIPENTFQTIVFILATASAFLVSILVVFIMLKRGKHKAKNYPSKAVGMGDKFLDYSSPIFVLSANEKDKSNTIEK